MCEKIELTQCKRPVYTKYEISKLIKNKRIDEKLTPEVFAIDHGVNLNMLKQIEEAKRSFTLDIYKTCANILQVDVNTLLSYEVDELPAFRAKNITKDTNDTVNLANLLFNEMIMQEKILAK